MRFYCYLVETTGFEPTTSASRTQRSTKLSHVSITIPIITQRQKKVKGFFVKKSTNAKKVDKRIISWYNNDTLRRFPYFRFWIVRGGRLRAVSVCVLLGVDAGVPFAVPAILGSIPDCFFAEFGKQWSVKSLTKNCSAPRRFGLRWLRLVFALGNIVRALSEKGYRSKKHIASFGELFRNPLYADLSWILPPLVQYRNGAYVISRENAFNIR